MSLVNNERVKLTATYLNGVAIAVFAVGTLAPLFSYAYSDADSSRSLWSVILVSAACLVISGTIHYGARYSLRKLQP